MGQLYVKMATDLKLRRYSPRTQKSYLWAARRFVRHFMRAPGEMGSAEIRQFLLMLHERGESGSSIRMYVASLHFLYAVTLERPAEVENIPWPRVAQKLPAVVSRDKVEARCGHERTVYNSCRNRHCPKCQALRQARWVAARMQRALPVRHFHVVFTLPGELRPLVREFKILLLDLLFAAASETLLQLGHDPKRLGGQLGVTSVVHTWGRNLIFHPHLHCIVTGGGLGADGAWVNSLERYLLPVKVLGMKFRGKFLEGLTRLYEEGKLAPNPRAPETAADLVKPAAFARLKNELYEKNCVVYAKTPFRKPDALFRYLGLYTHRVAISNHRLVHVDDHEVVFRTRGKQVYRLTPLEFMRRFLEHVLPRGFVKIRHFGLYAAGRALMSTIFITGYL